MPGCHMYFAAMNLEDAAKQLEALGNPTRLAIYRFLIGFGHQGIPVGRIRKKLDIPASTLSHHIAKLVHAGLVTQERDSRSLYCRADMKNMDALMTFLVRNCCAEESCIQMAR
jgi:DNA-binding transcriptional ArsR family regulator